MTRTDSEHDDLEWTGERYLPRIGGNIELEHLHRYRLAQAFVRGRRVLDIASGEGYGSAILSEVARDVAGVDISEEAVAHARSKYRRDNLRFLVGTCAAIPLPDGSVDAVVSFETIEHHDQHEEMMREIKRVLAPNGLLIISSPDRLEYSDTPGYHNPYHVKELYREEFETLLNRHFASHRLMGQRIMYGSTVIPEGDASAFRHFTSGEGEPARRQGMLHPLYLIAIASDGPLPVAEASVMEQPVMESDAVQAAVDDLRKLHGVLGERDARIARLIESAAARDGRIAGLEASLREGEARIGALQASLRERDGRIAGLEASLREGEARIGSLEASLRERDGRIAGLEASIGERERTIAALESDLAAGMRSWKAEVDDLRHQLEAVLGSRSWRVLAPVRSVAERVKRSARPHDDEPAVGIADRLRARGELMSGSALREIRDSGLFDAEFYLARNPDVRDAGIDPVRHYLLQGWKEGRDPSAAFGSSRYLEANPDVARARINPLLHFVRHGRVEGRSLGDVAAPDRDPPVSEPETPQAVAPETAAPEPAASEPVAPAPCIDPRVIDAEVQAIRESGLFDAKYYLSMYADIEPAPDDPIRHYCEHGWKEGRNPSDEFDTEYYLATYGDIRNAGINPFWHYVVAGAAEQRHAVPDLSVRFEDDIRFGAIAPDVRLIAFHGTPDWAALRGGPPVSAGRPQRPLPHESLGFYDPADPEALRRQAGLVGRHGLHGLCFALAPHAASAPLETLLAHDDIDLRFCVGIDLEAADGVEAIVDTLIRSLSDPRYIRVGARPLLVANVRGAGRDAVRRLRERLAAHAIGSPFLVGRGAGAPACADAFDALLDLPDDRVPGETGTFTPIDAHGTELVPYGVVVAQGMARVRAARDSAVPIFHALTFGRDDTGHPSSARALVYTRFSLRDYRRWLDAVLAGTRDAHPVERRFAFIDAWNDWNGGAFAEPDRRGGFGVLNETSRALSGIRTGLAMPKVSVIVTNYNHEAFLPERLDSVYGQTYPNVEVILLDDCSTDASRDVLARYAAAHPDVTRTLFNETNAGTPFRQWARGIAAATGELVWIAESDDFCSDRFLEVLVRAFDDPAVLLAYSKCEFVDRDGTPMSGEFDLYVSDLECAAQWRKPYVRSAHLEVAQALGVKNTIPNTSGVLFRRPVGLAVLDDPSWQSMRVAGDWVLYLHLLRGGKIAYCPDATNFFRRYPGSAAELTYSKEAFYREVGLASRTAASLYEVPLATLERCRQGYKAMYEQRLGSDDGRFERWYDFEAVLRARAGRRPNVMVATMGFYPGGAEILPIRMANEFKRLGLSVLLLNAALNPPEDGVRRMLRNDVPVVETARPEDIRRIIRDFGIEALNTHQWHIQKMPAELPDVFDGLCAHVASLHGMIEHGDAFGVTEDQIRKADRGVTTWVYTAQKNIVPFAEIGLFDAASPRFVKLPNGMQPPRVAPRARSEMQLPDEAFVLCCVSRAIPDKGWDEAVRVVARARELSGRDIRLVLVGNGPVYDQYRRDGVPDFVHLAGFSEDSVGHYAAADMGIMLTKFRSESFPLTIVDCLFADRPYIASDIGEIRNILTTGDGAIAGDVIALENWEVPIEAAAASVAAFATEPGRYAAAASRVRALASRYRIDVVASQYEALFTRDCAARRAEPAARPA